MSGLGVLLRRELSLTWGAGGGPLLSVGFLIAATVLFPLSLGSAAQILGAVAAGLVWVLLALASLLSLERLFARDFEDGALDIIALGPLPLEASCAVKCLAAWLTNGAPLALASPLAAVALGEPVGAVPLIVLTAALGSLAFVFVGGIGAALSLVSRGGALLQTLIVLPLLIPPVIFGAAAVFAWTHGLAWTPGLALLAAYALAAIGLGPIAMAGACRNALG
ncbi:MAG TPA: heme exporter protein CcmB [Caulobacteraceae bacterium]|jgi:heme exporter protein B|nr:heme exporter protein CcmB [Caulobacteraceae bacterium]